MVNRPAKCHTPNRTGTPLILNEHFVSHKYTIAVVARPEQAGGKQVQNRLEHGRDEVRVLRTRGKRRSVDDRPVKRGVALDRLFLEERGEGEVVRLAGVRAALEHAERALGVALLHEVAQQPEDRRADLIRGDGLAKPRLGLGRCR